MNSNSQPGSKLEDQLMLTQRTVVPTSLFGPICEFANFSSLVTLFRVAKDINFEVKSPLIWAKRYACHFPQEFAAIKRRQSSGKSANEVEEWQKIFQETELKHYPNLTSDQKKIFRSVKEGDLKSIQEAKPTIAAFFLRDKNRWGITAWANYYNYQHILDFLYQIAHAELNLPTGTGKDHVNRDIFDYLAACNQAESFKATHKSLPSIISPRRFSLFTEAVYSGSKDVVSCLLEVDPALINTVDGHGTSMLMHACVYGYYGVANLLISKGADVNITSPSNSSALFLAVKYGHLDVVRLLVEKRANLTRAGASFVDVAKRYQQEEIAGYLSDVISEREQASLRFG